MALGNDIMDPKSMDGPVIKQAPADLLKSNPTLLLTYHVMSSGFDYLSPVGVLFGGGLYKAGFFRLRYPNTLQMMGTAGLISGCIGMSLGLAGEIAIARKGPEASPIPWTPEGIQQRVDGLSHNFKVRVMDLGAWSGVALAAGALFAMGGPTKLKLAVGPLGVAQGLCLGSSLGSILSFGCIAYHAAPRESEK